MAGSGLTAFQQVTEMFFGPREPCADLPYISPQAAVVWGNERSDSSKWQPWWKESLGNEGKRVPSFIYQVRRGVLVGFCQ